MQRRRQLKRAILTVIIASLVTVNAGCRSWFRSTSQATVRDVVETLGEQGDPVVRRLVGTAGAALRDSVLNQKTEARLRQLVDSIAVSVIAESEVWRDSLFGQDAVVLVARLRASLLGSPPLGEFTRLRDDLLGEETIWRARALRDSLLDRRTTQYVAALRDELLGPQTERALEVLATALVNRAVDQFAERYTVRVRPLLEQETGRVRRYAWQIILGISALAVFGGLVFWRKRSQYRHLLELLTSEIHRLPDPATYDQLTRQIQRQAQAAGLESMLRRTLTRQGL